MIKTFNINLAGQVFNINEDAYEQLSAYFNSLRTFYANEADKDEIIRDIESRFAELFLVKGKNYIVTKGDAMEVINMMGNPQDFDEEKQQENTKETQQTTAASSAVTKRLYRDSDNGLLAGVCAGLSAYLGINDAIWLRLAFIALTFIGIGSPVLIYIILAVVMPKAETAAQKLEMRGEPINLSNIEKKIKDEADNITGLGKKEGKGFLYRLAHLFVATIGVFLKIILAIFKVIGILILGAILLSIFGFIIAFIVFSFMGTPIANKYFFDSPYDIYWVSIGGLLMLSTMFIFIALLIYKWLYKTNNQTLRKSIIPLAILFIIGLISLKIGGNSVKKILAEKKRISQTFPINYGYQSDTLQLSMNPTQRDESYDNVTINSTSDLMDFVSEYSDHVSPVEIEIYPSISDSFVVIKEYSANGRTKEEAVKNATSFSHTISQINNKLVIDPYIQFPNENTKYRNQKLKIKVYVPEGKVIRWDKRTENYINTDKLDINWDNVKNMTPPPAPIQIKSKNKIEIKTSGKNGSTKPNITISIDTDSKDADSELDKAQEEIDKAREKLEKAGVDLNDSLDIMWENRLQRQHYIFKMFNGELVPID